MDNRTSSKPAPRPIGGMHGGGGGGPMRGYERPKDARKTLLRLFKYMHTHKFTLILVAVLLLLSTIGSLAGAYFLKPMINNYVLPGNFRGLALALLVMGAIYLVSVSANYLMLRVMVIISQSTTNRIRQDLFAYMQRLPLRFFDQNTHGDLMSRFTNDLDNVQMALEQSMVQLLSSTVAFIGTVVMMVVLSPLLFLIILIILGLMFLISSRVASISRVNFKAQQDLLGNVNGYIEEMVDGLKVVKVFTYEDQADAEFGRRNEAFRQAATRANFMAGAMMPLMMNLNNVTYGLVTMFGGILCVTMDFSIGSLAAYLQFTRQVGMPVQMITNQFNNVLAALAGAERVFEVMDQQPEIDAGQVMLVGAIKLEDGSLETNTNGQHPSHWVWKLPQSNGSQSYVEVLGDVRFKDVTFGYDPDKTVLCDLSLYAKPGQKIALVGSTGAGKTTITNLINRFYELNDGSITYDGIDLRQIRKDDLRASLGMVLQDTHLFTGSILDNIRYGRLDASDEECIQAARQVNAHSFIRRLPDGYHTQITAGGANLSQGQRQLLSIARAAVADPPVMILDEATSSIDTRTERLIEQGMDTLMKDRTVFVIAHRLSTVRNANAILVIEGGEVIERGDHEDLLQQRGRYYQLYTGQSRMD